MKDDIITLSHGSGGRKMQKFISAVIKRYFSNPIIDRLEDGAVLPVLKNRIVTTTDSFVVSPVFFPGGDIGRLAVCGTVNDLAAMGAIPRYLTAGFILEEGLLVSDLEKILASMKTACEEAGVIVVAGDTKVVERGKADRVFINTAGIGEITGKKIKISASNARPGDAVIITGTLGDHEIAVLKERKGLSFEASIKSDCAPLNKMIAPLLKFGPSIHAMRDPTRGGLAAVLNEISTASGAGIRIDEEKVPVNKIVKSACSIYGYDHFYLANEGKMVIICDDKVKDRVIKLLKKSLYGKKSCVIGSVAGKSNDPRVVVSTASGGERILFMAEGEQLPRIC